MCKTDKHIRTYSMTGALLGMADFAGIVLSWASYTVGGADVVLMLDAEMALMAFEAFRAHKLTPVTRLRRAVVAMTTSRQAGAAVLVTADGKVILLPLPDAKCA